MMSNYRPVSSSRVACKIMKRVVTEALDHLRTVYKAWICYRAKHVNFERYGVYRQLFFLATFRGS